MSALYYWLDNGVPKPIHNIIEHIKLHGDPFGPDTVNTRRIDRHEFEGGGLVSTVFLVIDHSMGHGGPPVLFETLVSRNATGESCGDGDVVERYTCLADAKAGHWRYVDQLVSEGFVLKEAECPY